MPGKVILQAIELDFKIARQILPIHYRVNMKITAGGTDGDSESAKDAKFEFTPPELLLDTPFNMGCYKLADNRLPSAEAENFDMSPAACILECAPKGSDYRLAGSVRYIYKYVYRMESFRATSK